MSKPIAALLQPMKDRLAAATEGPWFLNDCEGEVIVLPEADLTMVTRDESGNVVSWGLPTSYAPERRILEVELDSWDEGEDEQDDQIRRNAALIAHAPTDQAKLIAAVEAVEALLCGPSDHAVPPNQPDLVPPFYSDRIRAALTQALGGDGA